MRCAQVVIRVPRLQHHGTAAPVVQTWQRQRVAFCHGSIAAGGASSKAPRSWAAAVAGVAAEDAGGVAKLQQELWQRAHHRMQRGGSGSVWDTVWHHHVCLTSGNAWQQRKGQHR